MIGSSDVSTIRQTHSHYIGIESYDSILEDYDIDEGLRELERLGLLVVTNKGSSYSLNVKKKAEIQSFL